MNMPSDLDAALQRLVPGVCGGEGPVTLAMHAPAHPELFLARFPAPSPDWIPASEWLRRQHVLPQTPVVPIYLGDSRRADVRVGPAIHPAALAARSGAAEQLRYLRWRVSLLATRAERTAKRSARQEPIASAVNPDVIEQEIARLDAGHRLVTSGDYDALLADARAIPHTLAEIGRLREIAFRAAGEGTGRAYDLDRFDHDYLHLFLWNRAARQIAGAYRLRLTGDEPERLYTATLFHYGPEFLRRLGPAIELGRSFICVEYQRSFAPLLLLWKAIGQFVARHPAHKTLFGPVSISNQYQSISRELMIAFLEKRELLTDLASLVRPRQALARRAAVCADHCRDLDELSSIVADLEPGRQGVPVLLRHYLRLGGKLLGFNVDPQFANALDGLVVVDLIRTDPRLLDRYLGAEQSAAVLAYHQKGNYGNL